MEWKHECQKCGRKFPVYNSDEDDGVSMRFTCPRCYEDVFCDKLVLDDELTNQGQDPTKRRINE